MEQPGRDHQVNWFHQELAGGMLLLWIMMYGGIVEFDRYQDLPVSLIGS